MNQAQIITDLRAMLDTLAQAVVDNTEARRPRRVSIKAKNLNHGDEIDWPHGLGRAAIIGWARMGEVVGISRPDGLMTTLGADERVRVYRA